MMTFQELQSALVTKETVYIRINTVVIAGEVANIVRRCPNLGYDVFVRVLATNLRLPIESDKIFRSYEGAVRDINGGNTHPSKSWPDAESGVRKAIEDLKDAPVSFEGNNAAVDKYRAILDAELRLLELRVKVELAEIGQAGHDRVMLKLAE